MAPGKRKRSRTAAAPDPPPVIEPEEERDDPIISEVAVDEEGIMDEGKAAHDDATIRSVHKQAILTAESEFFLHMTVAEEAQALTLFPKARLSHNSSYMLLKID